MTRLHYLVVVGLLGCQHQEPNYCPDVPVTHNCMDQDASVGSDGPTGCSGDAQCSGATPVCDTGAMICVQCTPGHAGACAGTSPVCENDDKCHACSSHDQCSSDVCLPDGSCSDGSNVAYVDPAGTDNTSCTKAMPCTKVAKALATTRPYVKFHGTTDEPVSINNQNVTLLADPAGKLTYSTNGIVLEVKGTSQVEIDDLEITGASGAAGYGISMPPGNTANLTLRRAKVTTCQASGIFATGGTLTISRSTISGNTGGGLTTNGGVVAVSQSRITGNTGGGISISASQFAIVNNFFFANGVGTSSVGAIAITTAQNAANRLDFNSFSKNAAQDGIGPAIQCAAGAFTARNNVMSANGTITNSNQTGGACSHVYSIATPGALPAGTGNIAGDPLFVNTATGDLHLNAGSPAIDAADPGALLTGLASIDIDGDARPLGAHADIGADEYKP